jgi:phytoene/squalene synthetase
MKSIFDKTSTLCSKIVTAEYSTSFYSAVKMLSPKIQDDIHAIYGLVRFADEIVDTFHDFDKKTLLDEFETEMWLSIDRKISLNPILNSFQNVVHKFNIDLDLIRAFFASMRADLSQNNYETMADYNTYIYGSADVVGLMCLKVFVAGDQKKYEELKYSAQKLGSAFQKVNFLRDLKNDTEDLNRIYFPHMDGQSLNHHNKDMIIAEINHDFDEALIGIKKLPLEAKFGVYTAYIYYKKLLQKLMDTDVEKIKTTRIRVSNPLKMMLLTKSFVTYRLNLI